MTQRKAQTKSPESIYVESAISHHILLEAGDKRGSNKAHDGIIRAIKTIRGKSDRGKDFLSNLLNHADENVRLWAAYHLLPLDEKKAYTELKHLTKKAKSWIVRSSAENTATEWQKGSLDVDWFMNK